MQAKEFKLIFTGSMGAGKTTAINTISEIEPIRTDVTNTDLANSSKAMTTTAMDYGQVTLAGGDVLRLYGTPGQARFDFMWEILGTGALGVVLLVDNSRADPIAELREYMHAFRDTVHNHRAVIGVGRTETHPSPSLDDYHAAIGEIGLDAPIFSVDVRRRDDVLLLLDVLFSQIEASESDNLEKETTH